MSAGCIKLSLRAGECSAKRHSWLVYKDGLTTALFQLVALRIEMEIHSHADLPSKSDFHRCIQDVLSRLSTKNPKVSCCEPSDATLLRKLARQTGAVVHKR